MNRQSILLQPIGEIENKVMETLQYELPKKFTQLSFKSAERVDIPYETYDSQRKQYVSPRIIDYIYGYTKNLNYLKVLGVCDLNAYTGRLNFVFGEADLAGKVAVIYISRLKNPSQNLFLQRVLKEAVHELGHLFGLNHCTVSACVMYFSNSISDTDRKESNLCGRCKERLGPYANQFTR